MKHCFSLRSSLWLVLLLFAACRGEDRGKVLRKIPPSDPKENQSAKKSNQAPAYALETLAYIRQNDRAPEGYVGGRTFQNREKRLPQKTPQGVRIQYREWDVHPKVRGENRGPERLVTGSDGSAWYTKDHYESFYKIE